MASVPDKRDTAATLAGWLAARRADAAAAPQAALDWARGRLDGAAEGEVAAVLGLLDTIGADTDTLAAALLHACVEDPAQLPAELRPEPLATLLVGQQAARRVWAIHSQRSAHAGTEGLRRLLLAIARDLRVVLILLARQVVRMRAAAALPETERRALAQLSADIHAPLANRLGVWQFKWELEDLAFRWLQPDTYKRIARLLDEKRGDRERFIEQAKSELRAALAAAGIQAEVAGRPKHIFSIWKKMQRKGVPFSELYDIRAIRVLVDDVTNCYGALGVVHGLWAPVPAEFDDYIANPKGNHYRSLHTAVLGPEGRTLEVQIRTHEMHRHAELGVAAHWRYKEGGSADAGFERKVAWMRQLLESREGEDESSLLAGLSTELMEDRSYVLTPQGQVIDLPRGGTVLDFAYHVHTEVGHRCVGAKVNGRIVPLTHQPQSGDRVEILTGKEARPRRDWLLAANGYLASGRARDKVRAWFHRIEHARNVQAGRELLERELRRLALGTAEIEAVLPRFRMARLEDLHVALALGDVSPSQVARALHEQAAPPPAPARPAPAAPARNGGQDLTIEGIGNVLTTLARCCQPVAGEPISGYLTRGRGVSIHRDGCAALQRLAARHPERIVPVEWGRRGARSYAVDVLVRAVDRKYLLKDLTNIIATGNAHVLGVNRRVDQSRGTAELRFALKVADFDQLGQLLTRMATVPGVNEARRTT